MSATAVTWIVLSFLLVSALLAIPFGKIADIHGRRPVMKIGILLFCVSAFANIFSPNMQLFLLLRVLQGVGAAMIYATNSAILVDAYPPEKRGSVMGIGVAAVFTGSSMGPVIGGIATHAFGWRSLFVIITAISLVAFIMAMVNLPNIKRDIPKEKVSPLSVVLYLVSLGLFMYGLATLTQNLLSYFILAAGIILLVVFVKFSMKVKAPVLDLRLLRNRDFTLSNLAVLFNYGAIFAIMYLLSIYMQLARGYNANVTGIILISQPIVQAILSPIIGRLSDKKSPSILASIGMGFCAAALFMFAFINLHTSIIYIIAGLIITGLGVAFFSSPNSSMIMGSVENKDYGIASSVMNASRMVGQVVGMAILNIIINAVIGNVPIEKVAPAAIVQNLNIAFPIFGAFCCIGIVFSLQRGGIRKEKS